MAADAPHRAAAVVAGLQAEYANAVYARDREAFLRLYDAAARVFDAWHVWEYDGVASWERAVDAWFGGLGEERVRVTFEGTRSEGSGDGVFASAIVTYTAYSSAGAPLRSLRNRITWGIRIEEDGRAVLLHEHTSEPLAQHAAASRPANSGYTRS